MERLKLAAAGINLRRAIILCVATAISAIIVLIAVSFSRHSSPMGYLFTDLDPAAARTITDQLTQQGIPWNLSADGSAVLAPADRLPALRMALASNVPVGKIGYEVLDAESPFGVSDRKARINYSRAIEGELARSIETLDMVQRARVHVVLPERALFATQGQAASAAITLKTTGTISPQMVNAVRALVAASVPELSQDQISIIDQRGHLLARAGDGGTGGGALEEKQIAIEARLRGELEALIERVTGPGRVRVEVAALLTRASRRDEADKFDPDGQVVARQTSVESSGDASEGDTAAPASVSTQLPERTQSPTITSPNAQRRRNANRETSEETTYNSSRIRSTVVEDAGKLVRLTVSIIVDPKTGSGRMLGSNDVTRLTRLAETAIGFDAVRGDRLTVEAMPLLNADGISADKVETPQPSNLPWLIGGGAGAAAVLAGGVFLWSRSRRKRVATIDESTVGLLTLSGSPSAAGAITDAAAPVPLLGVEPNLANFASDSLVTPHLIEAAGAAVEANSAHAVSIIRQLMAT